MARIIPVTGYPFGPGYDTPEAAIRGAQNHPLQQKARAAGAKLANTEFIDACWTDDEYYLRFSNYRTLHVFAIEGTVDWEVLETPETTETPEAERVGAEGVLLDWGAKLGRRPMDCSELIAKRRGAEFWDLFVNEMGLLVYLRRHLILCFTPIFRTDTRRPLLYVCEED